MLRCAEIPTSSYDVIRESRKLGPLQLPFCRHKELIYEYAEKEFQKPVLARWDPKSIQLVASPKSSNPSCAVPSPGETRSWNSGTVVFKSRRNTVIGFRAYRVYNLENWPPGDCSRCRNQSATITSIPGRAQGILVQGNPLTEMVETTPGFSAQKPQSQIPNDSINPKIKKSIAYSRASDLRVSGRTLFPYKSSTCPKQFTAWGGGGSNSWNGVVPYTDITVIQHLYQQKTVRGSCDYWLRAPSPEPEPRAPSSKPTEARIKPSVSYKPALTTIKSSKTLENFQGPYITY